jgi:hypothetical protein
MPDEIPNKVKKSQFSKPFTIFILIIACIATALTWYQYHKCLLYEGEIKQIRAENNLFEKKIKAITTTIENYEKLPANKELNDKEVIKAYIKENFKTIPREVRESIAENILKYSKKHKIYYELIVGLIEVESGFNPMAVSEKGARGLTQVLPKVWLKEFHIEDPFDLHEIDINIESGIKVLTHYLSGNDGCPKDDLLDALYAYVGGDSAYGNKVLRAMATFMLFRSDYNRPVMEVTNAQNTEIYKKH